MDKLVFTSNINCAGCVAKVKPYLDAVPGISNWQVDTGVAEKTITVTGTGLEERAILVAIRQAGFTAARKVTKSKNFINFLLSK